MMHLSLKIYRKLIIFLTYQFFILEKYDYDNNQKLQPANLFKKQVLTFWKNQIILQCLKHHRTYMLSDSTMEQVLHI